MRASRLVSLLLLLQSRGGLTATQLAEELEVSVRTIYRDVEALSASGVPIYADRGPLGGIRLVDGYRTRLTGLTQSEAESLFLSGLPGPAAELGLGTVVAAARLKVLAALPPELRSRATRLSQRFHLDAPGWFQSAEAVPHLAALAAAVWDDHCVQLAYDRGDRTVERTVAPLGLVLKGGVWYLVALADDQPRTYRVSRVREVTRTDTRFERPEAFELAAFWTESTAAYEASVPRLEVLLRVDPGRLELVRDALGEGAWHRAERVPADDPEGWIHLRAALDWPAEAPLRLLPLGDSAEVLEPVELRAQLLAAAHRTVARYAAGGVAALPAG
ncbi:MAG: WYL domain-containing protein [Chloroflexota bacterium]